MRENRRNRSRIAAVVDETQEIAAGSREAGIGSICLVPSQQALMYLIPQIGFAKVKVLVSPLDAYEQLAGGVRVLIAATVQANNPEVPLES